MITQPRTLHVEQCMGTVFTIDIRDDGGWEQAIAEVVADLHRIDRIFSPYRVDSHISRMQRGELTLAHADPDVATVLGLCADVQLTTDGHFSALFAGRIDPTGLVKGWAIERASQRLRLHGARNHLVNGGGDLQLTGESAPGEPWRVGISDPADASAVLATVRGRELAVATSGTAERGAHIIAPRTGRAVTELASATVIGESLTLADGYATAAFVMGQRARAWIDSIDGYEVFLVGRDGATSQSRGWAARAGLSPLPSPTR